MVLLDESHAQADASHRKFTASQKHVGAFDPTMENELVRPLSCALPKRHLEPGGDEPVAQIAMTKGLPFLNGDGLFHCLFKEESNRGKRRLWTASTFRC